MSTIYLGLYGTSIGWDLFQRFMIMTATLTGEWGRFAQLKAALGSGPCLVGATALLAMGNN